MRLTGGVKIWYRNKDAATEIYLSSLEKKLLKKEILKDKFKNLIKGERYALYNLKNNKKTIAIKGANKGSAIAVWDGEDYIKKAKNQLRDTNIYEEVPNDAKPLMKIILNALKSIRKRVNVCTDTLNYFIIKDAKFARFYLLLKIHKNYVAYQVWQLFPIVDIYILRIFLRFWISIYNQLLKKSDHISKTQMIS